MAGRKKVEDMTFEEITRSLREEAGKVRS